MNEDETMDRLQRQFPPLFFCSPATAAGRSPPVRRPVFAQLEKTAAKSELFLSWFIYCIRLSRKGADEFGASGTDQKIQQNKTLVQQLMTSPDGQRLLAMLTKTAAAS